MAFRIRYLIGDKGLKTVTISATNINHARKKFNEMFHGQVVTLVDIQQTKER